MCVVQSEVEKPSQNLINFFYGKIEKFVWDRQRRVPTLEVALRDEKSGRDTSPTEGRYVGLEYSRRLMFGKADPGPTAAL